MTPEIGPFSYAKLHGLKIAHFPLPDYYDPQKDMPKDVAEIEHMVNKQGMETFILDPTIYFSDFMHRFTYWVNYGGGQVSQELYKRWIGETKVSTDNPSGPISERLCMPGILMHPVKDHGT